MIDLLWTDANEFNLTNNLNFTKLSCQVGYGFIFLETQILEIYCINGVRALR